MGGDAVAGRPLVGAASTIAAAAVLWLVRRLNDIGRAFWSAVTATVTLPYGVLLLMLALAAAVYPMSLVEVGTGRSGRESGAGCVRA